MSGDITINATNAANILSDTWIKDTRFLVPSNSMLYQTANFQKTEMISGKCFVPIYSMWPQGHTLMAPGSNQDTNPSNSPEYPKAEIPVPALTYSQSITYEQLRRMKNDKTYTYREIIPTMNMLKLSHVGAIESLHIYGKDPNGFGDVAAKGADYVDITPANYAKGLFVDRGGARFDVYRGGGWTGDVVVVRGPSNKVVNRVLIEPADIGKLAVGDILRLASDGGYLTREYRGIASIIQEQTNLFGVDLNTNPLFQGGTLDNGGGVLTFDGLLAAMIKTSYYCDYSENSDAVVIMSPLSFGDVIKGVEDKRTFGGNQYNSKRVQRGSIEGIEIFGPSGKFTILAHPKVKAQHAFGLRYNSWISPGVCDVELIDYGTGSRDSAVGPLYNVPRSLRFEYKTYSQKALFCHEPAKQFMIYNINPSAIFDAAA